MEIMHFACLLLLICILPLQTLVVVGRDVIVLFFGTTRAPEGVLKVHVNGSDKYKLNTICWDASWGMEEANVACRQMGLPKATSTRNAIAGRFGRSILFGVKCNGSENNLADCQYSYSVSRSCRSDVHLTCKVNQAVVGLFDIRLAGSVPYKGVVQIRSVYAYEPLKLRPWGTFCFAIWNDINSEVVCRQLGFSGAKRTSSVHSTDNLDAAKFECRGNEDNIRKCLLTAGQCQRKVAPILECHLTSRSQQRFDIRLSNGPADYLGNVEVYKYGRWGVICSSKGLSLMAARVICHELGFLDVTRVTKNAEFGQSGTAFILDPKCRGDEWSIELCNLAWNTVMCSTFYTAGLVCSRGKFPSYDTETKVVKNATLYFDRIFLHTPGYPDVFSYQQTTDFSCTLTTVSTIDFFVYIHNKMFQENHQEELVIAAKDIQSNTGFFIQTTLFGDSFSKGPFQIKSRMISFTFKSNGVRGKGKFHIQIRAPKDAEISLNCSESISTPTTTQTSTITQTRTPTAITNKIKAHTTAATSNFVPTKREPAAVGGLIGGAIVIMAVLVIGITLCKLGYIHFGKANLKKVEFNNIGNDELNNNQPGNQTNQVIYENVNAAYENGAFTSGADEETLSHGKYADVDDFNGVNTSFSRETELEPDQDGNSNVNNTIMVEGHYEKLDDFQHPIYLDLRK